MSRETFKFLNALHKIMVSALSKNSSRDVGEIKYVASDIQVICPECKGEMGICKRRKLKLVGINSTYTVSIPTYGCRKSKCKARMKNLITPPNPYAAPRMTYDYLVQVEVICIRWQEHATYEEISARIDERFSINIDRTAIETILKTYEIACSHSYRDSYIKDIKEHGGSIVCIDVMEPLKGGKGILAIHDYWTGLAFGAFKMPNGKQETYEKYLQEVKERIRKELGVPIIGIISDAHVNQRKAIENIFEGVPHCLCHYHFYNLVLKAPKSVDSEIVTQVRSMLRKDYDIKQYQLKKLKGLLPRSQYEYLQPLFDPLVELSHWKRKPKDPCFTGLLLCSRLSDIMGLFHKLNERIASDKIKLSKHGQKVSQRMERKISEILNTYKLQIDNLEHISSFLESLVSVFECSDEDADIGLERFNKIIENLRMVSQDLDSNSSEFQFIEALEKYISTKGKLLFNYRNIPNAPTTNNFQELKFKQLKHFLRRVIGHGAAKEYLMGHAEYILFVNPKETRKNIYEILTSCDQSAIRKRIFNTHLYFSGFW